MKSKLFKSLIAVLLVISLLPTAAFAASRMSCGHADVAESSEYGSVIPNSYTSSYHWRYVYNTSECRECGAVETSTTTEKQSHFRSWREYTHSVDESGDTFYYYDYYCACNYYLGNFAG